MAPRSRPEMVSPLTARRACRSVRRIGARSSCLTCPLNPSPSGTEPGPKHRGPAAPLSDLAHGNGTTAIDAHLLSDPMNELLVLELLALGVSFARAARLLATAACARSFCASN